VHDAGYEVLRQVIRIAAVEQCDFCGVSTVVTVLPLLGDLLDRCFITVCATVLLDRRGGHTLARLLGGGNSRAKEKHKKEQNLLHPNKESSHRDAII
jgi:hypothetical protein